MTDTEIAVQVGVNAFSIVFEPPVLNNVFFGFN